MKSKRNITIGIILPVSDKSDRLVADGDFSQKADNANSLKNNGGGTRIRTGDNGFAVRQLARGAARIAAMATRYTTAAP